jgi:phosphinothricin acetyltransferase
MTIRDAVEGELPEITAIYNDVLMTSTAIYRDEPATVAERLAFWKTRTEQNYPTLVACDGGAVGFEQVAHFKEVGFKFGRFLDLVFVQLRLD